MINDRIEKKWKDNVYRMIENRLQKKIMNYQPIGNRDLDRSGWLYVRDQNR